MPRTSRKLALVGLLGALLVAGCGGGAGGRHTTAARQCRAQIGFEAPADRPLGRQQLAFAELAVATDDASNGTKITLVTSNTRGDPARASATSDQFAARSGIVGVVGPATNPEVQAVGSTFARAGMAFISASATGSALTAGANPTFFRVVAPDSLQGPDDARFIVDHLRPRTVTVIGESGSWSRQLSASTLPVFRATRIFPDQIAAGRKSTVASVAARVSRATNVVFLAWQTPSQAQQLGQILAEERKRATIVAADPLYAPGRFRVAGAYVSTWAPDITALPADAGLVNRARRTLPGFGIAGPPAYAATQVIDEAIASVCRSGRTPSRSGVLAAVRATDQPRSVLDVPIRFRADGNLADARWFVFRIDASGRYRMVPGP